MRAGTPSVVRERLAGGSKRGLGCAREVAAEALRDAGVLRELVKALHDGRATVAVRAANALKKVQLQSSDALDDFGSELLNVALRCPTAEARWNLWAVLGGLRLHGTERALAMDGLFEAIASVSALERVHALQALVDLSAGDAELRTRVRQVLQRALQDGSAAVRARARLLLDDRR